MKDEMRAVLGPLFLLILVFAGLAFVALTQRPDPGGAILRAAAHPSAVTRTLARPGHAERAVRLSPLPRIARTLPHTRPALIRQGML